MKQLLKKIISITLSCVVIFSVMLINVSAEEGQFISINGNNTQFVELFSVEDGKIYLPIRLAFNDFVEQGYSVQVVPSLAKENIAISVVKFNPATGEPEEQRKGVFIEWSKNMDLNKNPYGRFRQYNYIKLPSGKNEAPNAMYTPLKHELFFKQVNPNGDIRTFMSIDDLNTMVQFLIGDANYSIKLK